MGDFFNSYFATFVAVVMGLFGVALLYASVEDAMHRRKAQRAGDGSSADGTRSAGH